MSAKYINIHFSILEEFFELSYAYFTDYPITGIEERDGELIVSFLSDSWNSGIREELLGSLKSIHPGICIIKEEPVEDNNWNEEWEKNISPIIVNENIGIAPEIRIGELNTPIKIIITPKMSFGTGEHETTKMMCRFAEKNIKKGSYWIDAGMGTGVLAILAIKLGAEKVFAFDLDDWSIENAKENIKLNGVGQEIEIVKADINSIELPKSNGIMANLFLHLLIPNLNKFYNSLQSNGDLIVSGILKENIDELSHEAQINGFKHIETMTENDWAALHFRKE